MLAADHSAAAAHTPGREKKNGMWRYCFLIECANFVSCNIQTGSGVMSQLTYTPHIIADNPIYSPFKT